MRWSNIANIKIKIGKIANHQETYSIKKRKPNDKAVSEMHLIVACIGVRTCLKSS
ncbi:MAG: hypothetical protein ACR5K1_02135 [Wolbachia sp.]